MDHLVADDCTRCRRLLARGTQSFLLFIASCKHRQRCDRMTWHARVRARDSDDGALLWWVVHTTARIEMSSERRLRARTVDQRTGRRDATRRPPGRHGVVRPRRLDDESRRTTMTRERRNDVARTEPLVADYRRRTNGWAGAGGRARARSTRSLDLEPISWSPRALPRHGNRCQRYVPLAPATAGLHMRRLIFGEGSFARCRWNIGMQIRAMAFTRVRSAINLSLSLFLTISIRVCTAHHVRYLHCSADCRSPVCARARAGRGAHHAPGIHSTLTREERYPSPSLRLLFLYLYFQASIRAYVRTGRRGRREEEEEEAAVKSEKDGRIRSRAIERKGERREAARLLS